MWRCLLCFCISVSPLVGRALVRAQPPLPGPAFQLSTNAGTTESPSEDPHNYIGNSLPDSGLSSSHTAGEGLGFSVQSDSSASITYALGPSDNSFTVLGRDPASEMRQRLQFHLNTSTVSSGDIVGAFASASATWIGNVAVPVPADDYYLSYPRYDDTLFVGVVRLHGNISAGSNSSGSLLFGATEFFTDPNKAPENLASASFHGGPINQTVLLPVTTHFFPFSDGDHSLGGVMVSNYFGVDLVATSATSGPGSSAVNFGNTAEFEGVILVDKATGDPIPAEFLAGLTMTTAMATPCLC